MLKICCPSSPIRREALSVLEPRDCSTGISGAWWAPPPEKLLPCWRLQKMASPSMQAQDTSTHKHTYLLIYTNVTQRHGHTHLPRSIGTHPQTHVCSICSFTASGNIRVRVHTQRNCLNLQKQKFSESSISDSQLESQNQRWDHIRMIGIRYLILDSEITWESEFSNQNHQGALYKYSRRVPPESGKSSSETW